MHIHKLIEYINEDSSELGPFVATNISRRFPKLKTETIEQWYARLFKTLFIIKDWGLEPLDFNVKREGE